MKEAPVKKNFFNN